MFELKRQKIIRFNQSPRENLSRKTDFVFFMLKWISHMTFLLECTLLGLILDNRNL